jgi:polysaccharide export outer membrane protein
MKRRCSSVFVALLLGSILRPLEASPQAQSPGPSGLAADADYRIGVEDALAITVWKNDALSRVVTVRPDGKVSLPLVNDVQAAGLTALQLRDDLSKRLAAFMPRPEVSVVVNEVKSFKISVLGEVQKPGRYELRSRTTVLDALALAGGFKDFASVTKIVVLRAVGTATKRLPFNYKRVISAGGEADNFELLPNDIILVP